MKTLEEIQYEVGSWSQLNFGSNATPFIDVCLSEFAGGKPPADQEPMHLTTTKFPEVKLRPLVRLNDVACVLGISEEYGELCGATNDELAVDAIGDITIYTLDLLCRIGEVAPGPKDEIDAATLATIPDPLLGMGEAVGLLSHCYLKRFQGLRKMDDDSTFVVTRRRAIVNLIGYARLFCDEYFGQPFEGIVLGVWEKWENTVTKRDYKTDKNPGAKNGD